MGVGHTVWAGAHRQPNGARCAMVLAGTTPKRRGSFLVVISARLRLRAEGSPAAFSRGSFVQ